MEVDYRVVCCNTQEGQNEPDDDAQMSVRDSACTDTGTVAPDPDNAASPGKEDVFDEEDSVDDELCFRECAIGETKARCETSQDASTRDSSDGKEDEDASGEEPGSQECEDTSQGTVTAKGLMSEVGEELDNQIPSSTKPEGGADGVLDGPTTITCEGKENSVKKKHEPWALWRNLCQFTVHNIMAILASCVNAIGTGEVKQDSVKKSREPYALWYWCRFIVHVPVCATAGATGGIKHSSVKKKRTCTTPCALRRNLLIAFAVLAMCTTSVGATGNTQEGVVCENDPRNESIVKCQSSSMDRSLQILSIADCSRQFSPGQTEHQYCYLNNVTIDGHGTVDTCNSSFCTNLVIVVRDPDFSGTLNYSVIRDGKKMNIGNFTISAPIVNCSSVEYSGGILTVALDCGSQTLPPNQLVVLFSPINSNETVLNKTMNANNLTVALAHGDLVPGSYTIHINAKNNVGSALAYCEKPIDIAEAGNDASSKNPEKLVVVSFIIILWFFN